MTEVDVEIWELEWLDNNGQSISNSERFIVDNVGLSTVLTIRRLLLTDRGEFKLRVWNRCGEDTFPISIQITDRPGPPGRPSVQDQNVDSVRLLWSAPTQDGGSPVRFYTVEKCTGPLLSAFNDLSEYVKKTQPAEGTGPLPTRQKKNFMSRQRWSDDLLPIGRLANRGAIFRRLTMDGVFERNICFETECAPSVKKQLEDIVANVGDLIATLSCDLEGNPEPQIAWFKDDKELITPSTKYEARYSDGLSELTIKNIEESDAGQYCCRATNEFGSIATRATLTVAGRQADTPSINLRKGNSIKITHEGVEIDGLPPAFHHQLTDCSVKVGKQKILCVTNTTLPEPSVEWYHNGDRIFENDPDYLLKHDKGRYELTILTTCLNDQGEWRAVGKNPYGQCESSCSLTVLVPDGYVAPTFDYPLEDIRCGEGELLRLNVKVTANPPPKIVWYHDGEEIHFGDHYRPQYDDEKRNCYLSIMNVQRTDSGDYKCVARNVVGKAQCVCSVRVEGKGFLRARKVDHTKAPRFRMPLANPREIPKGAEMVLTCVVTGAPLPDISWMKNGKRYDDGVCTLTIFSSTEDDAGCYTCVAENIYGSSESSCFVHIIPPLRKDQIAPKFVELLQNRSVIENEEIHLECMVTGKPIPSITWYKDGLKLMLENRMFVYTDRRGITRLNIMKSVPQDSGEYSCEASNVNGKDFTHCHVEVIGLSFGRSTPTLSRCTSPCPPSPSYKSLEFRAPLITRPLEDAVVTIGNRERLELEVDSPLPTTVEWYHDGNLVAESRTLRTYFDGRVAFLKIYNARPEHQGKYVCKVSNKVGALESSAFLTVEEEASVHLPNMPVFTKKLRDIVVKQSGDSACFSCQVQGDPAPVLCWLHNGRAIHSDSSYRRRSLDDGEACLDIPSVSQRLCGTYTAVATNPFGDAHSSAVLRIDRPDEKVELQRSSTGLRGVQS
nr:Immunoglobulin I-set and Fibronectin domain containing protein [Haemonchus contortus]